MEKLKNENSVNTKEIIRMEEEINGYRKVTKNNEELIKALKLEDKVLKWI